MSYFISSRAVEKDDDLYTMPDFKATCTYGGFIDYDGFGHLSDGVEVSSICIYPSEIMNPVLFAELPSWATHVVWYNR